VARNVVQDAVLREMRCGHEVSGGHTRRVSDDAPSPVLEPTDRTRLRRAKERGRFDCETVHAILDEGVVAHVAVVDDGRPLVIPMAYARIDDRLYLHGAVANHLLRCAAGGGGVCVTVTLLDGLVLSRSWFHHSMNYRSVVVFGEVALVDDPDEKMAASEAFVEKVRAGRAAESRPPTPEELRATSFVCLRIEEASAKIRSGPPREDPGDVDNGHWGGVIPLRLVAGDPVPDDDVGDGVVAPS
jgi:nitroimidazol reductase NimA-like FMN-containing flavoprotein (pyridoxamine 5'-phosphate oxidase superfamily)